MSVTINASTSSGLIQTADTSGELALQSNGTTKLTVSSTGVTVTGASLTSFAGGAITSGTAVASTSGTSIDFTSIPSWVKRITVMFNGVSTSGTSQPMFQLGDSGGAETTGYVTATSSVSTAINTATAYTNGWQLFSGNAARIIQGNIVFVLIDSATNTWSGNGIFTNDTPVVIWTAGTKPLSATLDRVRITTAGGTDTFDAGSINILYEG